jgi:hypothetical protein
VVAAFDSHTAGTPHSILHLEGPFSRTAAAGSLIEQAPDDGPAPLPVQVVELGDGMAGSAGTAPR